jgi:hypothetical protein
MNQICGHPARADAMSGPGAAPRANTDALSVRSGEGA